MKALVVLTAALGVTLLVFWFAREQISSRVDPTPPLIAQLERLVEEGVLGGATPEGLVATLVLSGPFRESEPWDTAPRKRSTMNAWFGEPRQYAFMEALLREPRSAGWRMDAAGPRELAAAEEQVAAAARWAAEKGVRLRVIAHGTALSPVLRAALAAPPEPPAFERVLGVGLSLADLKAREPALAQALAARPLPAGQWFDLYSDPAEVPRVLVLERVGPGLEAEPQPLAWPGSSWVSTVVQLSERGAPRREAALPTAAPGSQLSARQFRSVKDGTVTQRVVDGKGRFVTGSLIVPKLDKEEVPPDPLAGETAPGAAPAGGGGIGPDVPLDTTGWTLKHLPEFIRLSEREIKCVGKRVLYDDARFFVAIGCFKGEMAKRVRPGDSCYGNASNLIKLTHRGFPAEVCKLRPPSAEMRGGAWVDTFNLFGPGYVLMVDYTYPDQASRSAQLDMFQKAIEALQAPAAK
ncbi:MAG: hypothetical protein HY928_07485 [Elusimicrobia bacterium]|nr:hypothetical protein [Elusimicrobiota bacterium]